MTMSRRGAFVWSLALGVATAVQGVWLVYLGRLSGAAAAQCLVLATAFGLLVQQAWVHRGAFNHRVDMLLVIPTLPIFLTIGLFIPRWNLATL